MCNHIFDISLNDINAGYWCPYCSNPPKKLCNNNECQQCYLKSFASHKNAKPEQRYAYEVVLPEMPCHLYVDIEAEFSKNNTHLANTIHDKFTQLIRELRSFMYIMHLAPTEHLDNLEIIVLGIVLHCN